MASACSLGGVLSHNQVATPGFETIGWSPPTLSTAQCGGEATCNGTKGSGFGRPGHGARGHRRRPHGRRADRRRRSCSPTTPAPASQQINNGILPRLGRPSYETAPRTTYNAMLSLEYRPSDACTSTWTTCSARSTTTWVREDMDWVVRANGNMIPLDEKFDSGNCANGCTVTSGTFANSQFFLEYRPYFEDTDLWGTNPGLNWRVNDWLSGDVQANYTKSTFHREVPSVLVATANNLAVNYTNNGGDSGHQLERQSQRPRQLLLGRRPGQHAGRAPRNRDQGLALRRRPSARAAPSTSRSAWPTTTSGGTSTATTTARPGRTRSAATIRASS